MHELYRLQLGPDRFLDELPGDWPAVLLPHRRWLALKAKLGARWTWGEPVMLGAEPVESLAATVAHTRCIVPTDRSCRFWFVAGVVGAPVQTSNAAKLRAALLDDADVHRDLLAKPLLGDVSVTGRLWLNVATDRGRDWIVSPMKSQTRSALHASIAFDALTGRARAKHYATEVAPDLWTILDGKSISEGALAHV